MAHEIMYYTVIGLLDMRNRIDKVCSKVCIPTRVQERKQICEKLLNDQNWSLQSTSFTVGRSKVRN